MFRILAFFQASEPIVALVTSISSTNLTPPSVSAFCCAKRGESLSSPPWQLISLDFALISPDLRDCVTFDVFVFNKCFGREREKQVTGEAQITERKANHRVANKLVFQFTVGFLKQFVVLRDMVFDTVVTGNIKSCNRHVFF